MSATTSKLMFSSSAESPAAKPRRRVTGRKNGPVTVVQGPKREAPATPKLSRATAEALYRSGGRMPSMDRLR